MFQDSQENKTNCFPRDYTLSVYCIILSFNIAMSLGVCLPSHNLLSSSVKCDDPYDFKERQEQYIKLNSALMSAIRRPHRHRKTT